MKAAVSDQQEIVAFLRGRGRHAPHEVLGIHDDAQGQKVVRVFRPGASRMHIELFGFVVEMHKAHESGLFEVPVSPKITPLDYRVFHSNGLLAHDPYAFWPTLGELDVYLFEQGTHYDAHRRMGGRLTIQQGVQGASFSVWAPSARSVSLVGDINHWDGRALPMRSLGSSGLWELFVPGMKEGDLYKFEIETGTGTRVLKIDPFALGFELRPKTGSKLVAHQGYAWTDAEWMRQRACARTRKPMSVYEVHLGSWKRGEGNGFLTFRELGDSLAAYCVEMGFTHVELLPIAEHPLDESWGYQVTGYFAPSSRFGDVKDFQYFVDVLHRSSIGVIVDWVPGHFPKDQFALARFDGTALYEHEDPRQGLHPHWDTYIFNFGRKEVSNFLLSSALFWLDVCHIDALRVDAVASMLYLDYGRDSGDWIPNAWGGKENLDAIEFFRHTNSIIHARFPGVCTIAEESTAFPGVTDPPEAGGLGFDYKWNMGWMNDTLRYFQKDPIYRSYHQKELTFGLLYAFTERFVLSLSHDEVVHGKKSLLSKMPGDYWQRFAQLRLLLSYMICQPGKKLLFMGGELAQWDEWSERRELQWFLLQYPQHAGVQRCVRELNHFYKACEPLWADDETFHGFEWVDFSDSSNSVISYIRKVPETPKAVLCVHNFTAAYHARYSIPLRHVRQLSEVFNSDRVEYGGSGKVFGLAACSTDAGGEFCSAQVAIPPLATVVYEILWS